MWELISNLDQVYNCVLIDKESVILQDLIYLVMQKFMYMYILT